MAQKVVLYSRNDCRQCKETKKRFKEFGIDFEEINLDEHPELINYVKYELGYSSTPVIVTDNGVWAGFQPSKIKAIKKQLATKAGFLLDKIKCLC